MEHKINKHLLWDINCLISAVRGFRNGIITGARIRLPYVFQAVIYAIVFRQGKYVIQIEYEIIYEYL